MDMVAKDVNTIYIVARAAGASTTVRFMSVMAREHKVRSKALDLWMKIAIRRFHMKLIADAHPKRIELNAHWMRIDHVHMA